MPSIGSSSVAYATLVTNHDYGIGAAVLGFKLKKLNTSADRIIMVTNSVPQNTITLLEHYWDKVVNVSQLESSDNEMLVLLKRPELSVTYSKLNVWKLTDYQKIAFLDADMMPLSNVDDLFEYEELSACRDIGWPDCFNSGLFVLKPSVGMRPLRYFLLLHFCVLIQFKTNCNRMKRHHLATRTILKYMQRVC